MKEKAVRKLCLLFLFALLVSAVMPFAAAAADVDMDYTGPVDNFTGQPIGGNSAEGYGSRVKISEETYYDRDMGLYVYSPDGSQTEVYANVAGGMVVNYPVSIDPGSGADIMLYRNGERVADPDWRNIAAAGHYTVEANAQGAQSVLLFTFTVVGEQTGLINGYTMPEGFVIAEATLNDEEALWDRFYVSMSEEGRYYISYACPKNGLSYTLNVIIDHTPPTLALANVENGRALGPVDISDLEPGCSIIIYLNGERIEYEAQLARSGSYAILVADPADNLSIYEFTILVYFNINSYMFFILVLASIAGTAIYVLIKRKNLRVR